MKSIIKFFSSVKLAIILLIIITSTSVIGTFIPQNRSPAEYVTSYGQLANFFTRFQLTNLRSPAEYFTRYGQLAISFIRFQLTNLYHSLWFIGLLFLFALNIIICTLSRLFPKFRKVFQPKLRFEQKNINALKIKQRFRKNWNLAQTKEKLRRELASRHYRLREEGEEKRSFLLARKRILGWFGADVVHLGLLIILAGGIISGLGGFREKIKFFKGKVQSVPKADFKLRLDKFETEYYPDGRIRDWKSTLTVFEEEKPLFSKTIEVNHPLSYKGFVFYQYNHGWNWDNISLEIWVKKRNDPVFLDKLKLKVGERARLEDGNIHIAALHFIPDFVINENNEITTRSLEPNNPAAFIEGWQGDEKIFSAWIFSRYPDFSRIHSKKEIDLSFELINNFEDSQYSEIQAAKDPGVNVIWIGCALVMIGLALAFYWPTREIKVILEESQGKTEVMAGGIASKNRETFQSEFEKIMTFVRILK